MQKFLCLCFCCLLMTGATTFLSAQKINLESDEALVKKYMQTITAEELKDHLYILASDAYEGRETGTLGQKKAADYIARHFMKNGLKGPVSDNPNPYFQPIDFFGRYVNSIMISSPSTKWVLGKDFVTRSISELNLENAGLVFIGYGLEQDGYNASLSACR
ncbi:MAG: peptidase M28, partial [Bacteroidota bacterium]